MRTCTKCGLHKPDNEMHKGRTCKACRAAYEREYRLKNAERLKARHKEWCKENAQILAEKKRAYHLRTRDARNAALRADRKANPEKYNNPETRAKKTWERRLRHANFTQEIFETAVRLQRGRCAICATELDTLSRHSVHADHCHTTGKPRGVLCGPCNQGLGMFKDAEWALLRAVEYLRKPTLGQDDDE